MKVEKEGCRFEFWWDCLFNRMRQSCVYLGSSWKAYWTPWPWCTSQSTIRTLRHKATHTLYKLFKSEQKLITAEFQENPLLPLDAVLFPSVTRRHRDVIKHGVSVHQLSLGVMSWRPATETIKITKRSVSCFNTPDWISSPIERKSSWVYGLIAVGESQCVD